MLEIQIDNKYRLPVSGSKGTQVKFRVDNTFYKQDALGNEGVSEHLCSLLLECTDASHVNYVQCIINGRSGCYSNNFLGDGENIVTLKQLHLANTMYDFNDYILSIDSVRERYFYTIHFVKQVTGLDIQEYLDALLCVDFLTLNPDRHADNIAFITDGEVWKVAPIFDNGQSLGANQTITPSGLFNADDLHAATLSGSFNEQLLVTHNKLRINYTALFGLLEKEPESRNKRILLERLEEYTSIFKFC